MVESRLLTTKEISREPNLSSSRISVCSNRFAKGSSTSTAPRHPRAGPVTRRSLTVLSRSTLYLQCPALNLGLITISAAHPSAG